MLAITASAGVLAALLMLGAAPAACAQGTGHSAAPSMGGVRVAMVNMYVIMKGYKKVEMYNEEMKTLVKPYTEEMKKLQKNYKGWLDISQDKNKPQKDRDEATKYALEYEHQIKVLNAEWNKKIVAREDQTVVQLYREIEDAIARYAKSNGIHLVFQYFEPLDVQYSPKNIGRKVTGVTNFAAVGPIYIADGLDISNAVVGVLNSQYPAAAAAHTNLSGKTN
jgi:Skp family chaperone for outer membrane proteins